MLLQVIVSFFFRTQRASLQKMHRLVEHAGISGCHDITTGSIRQPQIVIGEKGANALSVGRMPPVLHVTLEELALGATDQLLTGEPGRRMDQRHGVLQLIPETVGAAGLIIAAPAPETA